MFWSYIRIFATLDKFQHLAVYITTFAIPVCFEIYDGWRDSEFCLSCVNWGRVALYFAWYQIAMLLIGVATKRDRAIAKESLDRVFSELRGRVDQLNQEYQEQMTGTRDSLRDLEVWVRNIHQALSEQLAVDLPGRSVQLRATFTFGVPTASATVSVVDRAGRILRLLRWGRRQARNYARRVYKIVVGERRAP